MGEGNKWIALNGRDMGGATFQKEQTFPFFRFHTPLSPTPNFIRHFVFSCGLSHLFYVSAIVLPALLWQNHKLIARSVKFSFFSKAVSTNPCSPISSCSQTVKFITIQVTQTLSNSDRPRHEHSTKYISHLCPIHCRLLFAFKSVFFVYMKNEYKST